MFEPSDDPFAREFHVTAKSAEIEANRNGESVRFRIDVVESGKIYSTRAYIERRPVVQPMRSGSIGKVDFTMCWLPPAGTSAVAGRLRAAGRARTEG